MAVRRRSRSAATDVFPGFQDVAEIGAGSLATVYRAREADTGRAVALKLLNVRDVSARALESFQRESVALGAVSAHPNIVTLYRTFQTADGRPVLVLELCAGSIFDELRTPGGLSAQRVVAVGVKMAAALETAHRAEILHRDVKPQNILITEFGEPALADFGVAMLQASSQTTSGLFDFTTLHVAPELLEGRPTSPATDVYELASTLYQLLAGQSAFRAYEGESPASVILRILRDPVRPLVSDGVPAALSDLLVSSMSKDQDGRPASAAEFAAALDRVERTQGWPATTFLVRDLATRSVSGPGPIAVPSPFAVAGVPAWTAASGSRSPAPGPAGDSSVRPIERGSRLAVPVGQRAGSAPMESVPQRRELRAPAEPAGPSAGGLSQLCANGHLVSATVRFCPICGSVELGPASSSAVAPDAVVVAEVGPDTPPQPGPVDLEATVSRRRPAFDWNQRTPADAPAHVPHPPAVAAPEPTRGPTPDPAPDLSQSLTPQPTSGLSGGRAACRPDHDPWDPDGRTATAVSLLGPPVRDTAVTHVAAASNPFDPDSTATRPRRSLLAERHAAPEPAQPPDPPQPVWGAAPSDPEVTTTHPARAAFPIPPHRAGPAGTAPADPDRTTRHPDQELAALPIEWGALRISVAADPRPTAIRSGRANRSDRLLLRARPSMSAPGSRGWATAVIGIAILVVAATAGGLFAAGLMWPIVLVGAVGVAAIAGLVAAWLAMPTVVVDGSGVRTRGQRPVGHYAWADVVHFEPRYIDAGHAIVVLHTANRAIPLVASAAGPAEVAQLASRLDERRVRARDLARR